MLVLFPAYTGNALCFLLVSDLAGSVGQLCDWNTYFKLFICLSFLLLVFVCIGSVMEVVSLWLFLWENYYSEKGCAPLVCECVDEQHTCEGFGYW